MAIKNIKVEASPSISFQKASVVVEWELNGTETAMEIEAITQEITTLAKTKANALVKDLVLDAEGIKHGAAATAATTPKQPNGQQGGNLAFFRNGKPALDKNNVHLTKVQAAKAYANDLKPWETTAAELDALPDKK